MWWWFQWTVAVMVVWFHPAVGAPCFFLKGGFLASDKYFWIIFFGLLLCSLCDRTTSQLWKKLQGLVCVFAEDFEDARKCRKVNEIGDRTVLLVISVCIRVGKNMKCRSILMAKIITMVRTIPPSKLPKRTMLLPSNLADHFQN